MSNLSKREENVRVLVVEPNKEPEIRVIKNELDSFREIVGGYIECVPLPIGMDTYYLVCNEEGKLLGLPPNRKVGQDVIVGTFLVVKANREEFVSLNEYEASAIVSNFIS